MPELPEVETSRRGILPYVKGQVVGAVVIRKALLRWPIPADLPQRLVNQSILDVTRRGKYLMLHTNKGCLLIHLGMSGHLRILPSGHPFQKHDHVDILFRTGQCLRFTDPRRFGAILWATDPNQHPLLAKLGVEPLSRQFTADYLFQYSRKRTLTIKEFIMDSHIVVGVGNIYTNEALFSAGIHPQRAAGRISLQRYQQLVIAIKVILKKAIQRGGTTLRDFQNSAGKPGYFQQHLQIYGRQGLACLQCKDILREIRLSQRSSVYCPTCQR